MLNGLGRENFFELRSELDPELDSRSLDEPKLFSGDGGVGGGVDARACWFGCGKRGRADVASGRASSARRRKGNSFMVPAGHNGWRWYDGLYISLRWSIGVVRRRFRGHFHWEGCVLLCRSWPILKDWNASVGDTKITSEGVQAYHRRTTDKHPSEYNSVNYRILLKSR